MPGKTMKNQQPLKNSKSKDKDKKRGTSKVSNISEPEEKPKRIPSGYILFTKDERIKVLKDFPDHKAKDVIRELGSRWSNAEQKVRDKYNKISNDMKEKLLKSQEQANVKVSKHKGKKPEPEEKNKKNQKTKKTADYDSESD